MKQLKIFFIFLLFLENAAHSAIVSKKRVLIGAPVRQKPAILKEFLQSLTELNNEHFDASYFFIDDNNNPESAQILQEFAQLNPSCLIAKSNDTTKDVYHCDENTHYWHEQIIWKVAFFKDFIIDFALQNSYDYLFLIDSDIVMHPQTINHLITVNKNIVSNVFWTQWQPGYPKLPQVWYLDEYKQYRASASEHLTAEEIGRRQSEFIRLMLTPGTYEVGGLGACTLISRAALAKGINFKQIKNISFWGEDRHFCVRAIALGLDLFVDTHYPAYHIYRETDLEGITTYKENCRKGIYQI